MPDHSANLAALIGSRICHDLISPVGGVLNGLELLEMSEVSNGPEMALVSDSASNASAQIRLFRLAFGLASGDQSESADELRAILGQVYKNGKLTVDWQSPTNVSRITVKAALLGLLCIECAVPYGGTITIAVLGDTCDITASADRIKANDDLWRLISGTSQQADIAPADVQFLLLANMLADQGRTGAVTFGDTEVSLKF